MKHIVFFAMLVIALPAAGQAQKPEAPKPEAKAEAKASKPAVARKAASSKRQEDARHCLDRPTNTEIIKCAEEYL